MKALVFALTVPVLGLAAATPAHAEVHVGVGIVLGQPSYRQGYGFRQQLRPRPRGHRALRL